MPIARSTTSRSSGPDERSLEDGFTLVELLVVVVIVAILAGVAIPTFLQQRERAWESAVRSELRSAVVALESRRAELGSYDAEAITSSTWGYVSGEGTSLSTVSMTDTAYCLVAHYGEPEASEPAAQFWVESGGPITDVACT